MVTRMTTKTTKIDVPKSVMSLPEADRDGIIGVLAHAVRLPSEYEPFHESSGDEADIWHSDPHSLLGQIEDNLYVTLLSWTETVLPDVMEALGLDHEFSEVDKGLEFDLMKGRGKISARVAEDRAKRERFIKYIQGMNAFSKTQLKRLDSLLRSKLPNYAQIAEDFMTRAGFIGKIRNQAEAEAFDTIGALIDRFPETIKTGRKMGVVLTLPEKARAAKEGRTVKILPLTPLEAKAVEHASQHAASKMTEVAQRHIEGIKQAVMRAQSERWEPMKLAQVLYDAYGDQNRDWRRVALTELAFAANDAYLSGCTEGDQVVGMGANNACKHCQHYVIGKEFTVTHELPKNTNSHEMKFVWPGKSNYKRKVSEYIPAIPMHPHCRCRWHKKSRFYNVEPSGTFKRKETWELIQEERLKRGMGLDPNLPVPYNMRQ